MPRRPALPKKGPGSRKMAMVMREFAAGTLVDSHGTKVTDPEQAQAIGASEARRAAARGRKRKS